MLQCFNSRCVPRDCYARKTLLLTMKKPDKCRSTISMHDLVFVKAVPLWYSRKAHLSRFHSPQHKEKRSTARHLVRPIEPFLNSFAREFSCVRTPTIITLLSRVLDGMQWNRDEIILPACYLPLPTGSHKWHLHERVLSPTLAQRTVTATSDRLYAFMKSTKMGLLWEDWKFFEGTLISNWRTA